MKFSIKNLFLGLIAVVCFITINTTFTQLSSEKNLVEFYEIDADNTPEALFNQLDKNLMQMSNLYTKLMSTRNRAEYDEVNNNIRDLNKSTDAIKAKINELEEAARAKMDITTVQKIKMLWDEFSKKRIG